MTRRIDFENATPGAMKAMLALEHYVRTSGLEPRLLAVPVWRETPFFTPRERAALAWTEAVTELGRSGVPDPVFEEARRHFTDAELVSLTMAIIAINGWNRLAVSFRSEPGSYQP